MAGDKNIFYNYNSNNIFLETGSYLGRGIQHALDAGFKRIISIEITPKYYDICTERFADNPEVEIVLGDSSKLIGKVLSTIDEPCTLWLDGHFCDATTLHGDKLCPLLDELDVIKLHPIKTHTILIDDRRCWNVNNHYYPEYLFGEEDIVRKIKEINPEYKITYDDGYIPDDVIVAQIKK